MDQCKLRNGEAATLIPVRERSFMLLRAPLSLYMHFVKPKTPRS